MDPNIQLRKCNSQRSHQSYFDRFRPLIKALSKDVLLAAIKKGVPENQKLPTLRKYREVLSCERRSKL